MNIRREPAYLIRDYMREEGLNRFSLGRDTTPFLAWIQADHLRAATWEQIRGYWQQPDADIVAGAWADSQKRNPLDIDHATI